MEITNQLINSAIISKNYELMEQIVKQLETELTELDVLPKMTQALIRKRKWHRYNLHRLVKAIKTLDKIAILSPQIQSLKRLNKALMQNQIEAQILTAKAQILNPHATMLGKTRQSKPVVVQDNPHASEDKRIIEMVITGKATSIDDAKRIIHREDFTANNPWLADVENNIKDTEPINTPADWEEGV
jgi:hypothetical protein